MNFDQFKREVALAAQGHLPPHVAEFERALRKKEIVKCAQVWSQLATDCTDAQCRGERPPRMTPPSTHLPPVA
jgi:hypothetical protein